ncbi:MAG: DUF6677 family protein [Planctomycetota bacterium]
MNVGLVLGVVTVALVGIFATTASPRQRNGVVLAWLFPGLGHFYLGERKRGLVLGGMIVATFLVGMILADFRNISPFDRHPTWGIAHAFGGLMSGLAALLTKGLLISRENPFYNVGCLYSGVATLLNILAMVDVWDLAGAKAKEPAEDAPEMAAAGTEATS